MESTEEFSCPIKIHFASQSNCVVAAVFADRVLNSPPEIVFCLGKVRVAVLGKKYLVVGSRKILRSTLHPEKPFFYEPSAGDG